jgi:hypothetical protein
MLKFPVSFLFLFFVGAANAQMLLPDPMYSQQEYREFARKLLEEMPSLRSNGQENYTIESLIQPGGMVQKMAALADTVRADAKYMQAARQRPLPMTFKFYTVKQERRSQVAVNEEFITELAEYYKANYQALAKESVEEATKRIDARILELVTAANAAQSMGIITGLGQAFPADQRREILGQKSLAARVASLKRALDGIKDGQLRESFDSERFGIARAKLTKAIAIDLLDSAVAREKELIQLVSIAELLSEEKTSAKEWTIGDVAWMLADGRDLPGFLDELPSADKFSGALFGALKNQAKAAYTSEQQGVIVEVPDKTLIVKEVPPYLGVFRGCTSGDCSTTHSWAYPFSPYERDYFVYEEGNPDLELGYISGNFLKVNGIDTFMLRDMVGAKLSPAHIPIIIQGFAASLPFLGVNQMSITHEQFAIEENIYEPLWREIQKDISFLKEVRNEFQDGWIRERYLNPVVTSTEYDSVNRHRSGRLYDGALMAKHGLPVVRSMLMNGNAPLVEPGRKLSQKEMLERIRHAYLANNPAFLNGMVADYNEWAHLFAVLRNEGRQTLKDYYANVEAELKKAGLKLSNSVQRDFMELFFDGHMNAKGVFESRDKEELERTYAMIMERYTLSQNPEILRRFEKYFPQIMQSDAFKKAVTTYLTRQRPQDEVRMHELWEMGYHFDLPMSQEQFKFLATHAQPEDPMDVIELMEKIMATGENRFTDTDLPRPLLELVVELLDNHKAEDETPSIRAAAILAQLTLTDEDVIKEVKRSVKDEDNIDIRFPLAVALLRSGQELDSKAAMVGYAYVLENLDNIEEIRQPMLDEAKAVLKAMPEETKADLQERWDEYVAKKARKHREEEDCEDRVLNENGRRNPRAG